MGRSQSGKKRKRSCHETRGPYHQREERSQAFNIFVRQNQIACQKKE